MRPPLRIAVLECDTPNPKTQAKYGGYGGVFKALLQAGADALDKPELVSSEKGLEISTYDVVESKTYPKLEDIDAVLLTGSKHNSFDDDAWIVKLVDFTNEVLAQDRVRLIGVCFGHQIVGRAMGVKVHRNPLDWEVAVCDVDLTPKGKELFGRDTLRIHQMHKDIVFDYPADVEKLGSSEMCAVQGMYVRGRVMTVQGHPEFNQQIMSEILDVRHALGVFDDARHSEAMGRADKEHDGVAVARAFLQFLLDD